MTGRLKSKLALVALTALPLATIASTAAQAQQAPTATAERAGAELEESNGQFLYDNAWILPAIGVIALGLAAYFLFIEDDDGGQISP